MKKLIATMACITSVVMMGIMPVMAHNDDPNVTIHTFENGEKYTNCSFIIHPTLTQDEFHRFTTEAGNIIYYQPLTGASTLGKFKFNVGIAMSKTPIDQAADAWNNTFAHPITEAAATPHYLGDQVNIPNLRFAMGLTKNLDVSLYFTKDVTANYGFWGAALKYAKPINADKDLFAAARISHSRMFGPADLTLNNTSLDALISKKWKIFEPYVGLSAGLNQANETTSKVDLSRENVVSPRSIIGLKLDYKFASAGIEWNYTGLNTLAFKFAARF